MSMTADDVVTMVLFAHLVEERSFTAAAARLGVRKSTVSRRLGLLETRLGVRLLHRTTRRLSLTDAGLEFYRRCAKVKDEANEAARLGEGLGNELRGVVRVNAPAIYGARHLTPLLGEFLARHPEIEVRLSLEDRFVDVVHGGFDLVVRITRGRDLRTDPSVGVRKLGSDRFVVCASPEYLRRSGRPEQPEDLIHHRCLRYEHSKVHEEWRFERGGEPAYVPVPSSFVTNSAEALKSAVLAGVGVAVMPRLTVADELKAGALVEVLPGFSKGELGIYLLTPSPRHASARVRALISFLAAAG